MKTFTEYWEEVVIPNFPNYWSSDIIAWEQDAWNAYSEAETEEGKKEALNEIRRLNHIIADAVVDSLIDKEVVSDEDYFDKCYEVEERQLKENK